MRKIILLLSVSSFLTLAACSSHSGKSVFDPTDVGQDIDSTAPGTQEPTSDINSPSQDNGLESAPVAPFPEDAQKFNQAWKRTDTALLLDCYQGNSINWDKVSTDKRVVGVIHRATIGLRVDAKFAERKDIADRKGFLWGGYHLGKPGDPIQQAQLFLKTIGDTQNTLMVLDLEDTSDKNMMGIADAQKFMQYVYEQTGKMPVVYANHIVTKALSDSFKSDPYFRASRLWYARFRTSIPDFPNSLWPTYFIWQFSSAINCAKTGSCLYNVPGTDRYIDVNVFYGTKEALRQQWTL